MSLPIEKSAALSECGQYRYMLSRTWNDKFPGVLWIMLNPSTADADNDDPTIRRCIAFAKSWGCGSITVVNLFAYRATSPKRLLFAPDPVGPENDRYIRAMLDAHNGRGDYILCAWGATAGSPCLRKRWRDVMQFLPLAELDCLGVTRDGHPKHPLYCKSDLGPTKYEYGVK